jgi:hypothetical protein
MPLFGGDRKKAVFPDGFYDFSGERSVKVTT